MEVWMAGAALAALLALATWDVSRPGRAGAPALGLLRAVGGLGLAAMAGEALTIGAHQGALVAAAGALPLLAGLPASWRDARAALAARRGAARAPVAAAPGPEEAAPRERERQAAA